MAQRHAVAEARLLKKWVCMKCSATHRGTKAPGHVGSVATRTSGRRRLREGRPSLLVPLVFRH